MSRVMIMAGGTGGHVFPALAVADELRARGLEVFWLGTPDSFEARLVPRYGYDLEMVSIKGLRGNGLLRWLAAPFKIALAMLQAMAVLRRRRPDLVVGMGGFVTGPGGVVARLLGMPLLVHEQNAIPGLTNRWLARIATRVLEAFPGSFSPAGKAWVTGNPVRPEIAAIPAPAERLAERQGPLRLLLLGGSQGARVLNETLPEAVALLDTASRPQIRHQSGRGKEDATRAAYRAAGVEAQVMPFVEDMAEAYAWADLVLCRAGALTIAELAAAGVAALLVPYPFAVDDHQTHNGRYLADQGAARLLPQFEIDSESLAALLQELADDRAALLGMAEKARSLALPDATGKVADHCQAVLSGEVGRR